MQDSIIVAVLATGIVAGTPLLFASLGELLSERAGVMNLGVEGMMLIGAVTGFAVDVYTQNIWAGILAAMLAGGLMALIHAFLSITLKANQVVSGLALTIFGTGLSAYLGKPLIGVPAPVTFKVVAIPGLSEIPWLGTILFSHDVLVYISYGLVALIWFVLYRTKTGLILRSVGENPAAADAAGINVFRVRYLAVVLGGMLSGAAGAYLSLAYAPSWLENMTAGRGWIALALVIFAMWNPLRALAGAYVFGSIDALGFHMQTLGVVIPSFFLKMLPYLFTFIILIVLTRETKNRRVATPEALGVSYSREDR
ncbi:nucleoside ABC transporter membrane protein [Hydrogenispora ethanolica]|jgi:simple sugar transport system permease protein|uniref:Nucleoside ABC transporter membrane protein n=1 Tax=Hydrogenispora ethanolica TaxID=1082276 RepID=A0A4R1S1X1_HYDET|nr:ABC transporter permease [Hydrogenispora ethanolica]TCL73141.1 nucleoside ABC transporter membrane protein [Hydrogenispora ethanolica]